MKFLTLDFETRSPVNLKFYSTTRYASHPETDILCLGLKWQGQSPGALVPQKGSMVLSGVERPIKLMHAIDQGIPINVHNLSFEKRIYKHICVNRWGWPEIPDEQWIDTTAICRYYALPAKLSEAAAALKLDSQKDMAGNRVMLQLSKPRKPRKAEIALWMKDHDSVEGMPNLWWEDEDKLQIVIDYCKQDLNTQEALLLKLGRLPPELEFEWRFDDMVNDRGVPIDWGSLIVAQDVVAQSLVEFNTKLQQLTADPAFPLGRVSAVTQRKKILDWCSLKGYGMVSTNKASVEDALSDKNCPEQVRQVLQVVQDAGKSSLGKLETMSNLTDDDWRVRDTLVWHGAATGRKAGRGIQPQNFPRDCMKPEEADEFFSMLEGPDPFGCIDVTYCSPQWVPEPRSMPDVISSALRSFIRAEEGKTLFVSDFSNIETRILAWVSGCKLLNEAFSTGKCPYRQFASRVYNVREDSIAKGSQERQLGKVAVLGLGYGMGHAKFKDTAGAPPYNVLLEEVRAKEIVSLYRQTYPEVPMFWRECETAFMEAINNKTQVQAGRVAFGSNGEWGWIVLPSGKCIWMNSPAVKRVPDRWREGKTRLEISYQGVESGTRAWKPRTTYGGSLVESICQAVAACLLQEALHRVEAAGYPVVLSVHDEIISEAPEHMPLAKFHETMKVRPAWALDLPVECESGQSRRYGK